MPEPSANCIGVDESWEIVHEAPWRTKPRARVFSVDSSPFDSFQFVGLPPTIPELHASDYSGATAYDSNFNSTNSYIPLPVGSTSWCLDSVLLIMFVKIIQLCMAPLCIQVTLFS